MSTVVAFEQSPPRATRNANSIPGFVSKEIFTWYEFSPVSIASWTFTLIQSISLSPASVPETVASPVPPVSMMLPRSTADAHAPASFASTAQVQPLDVAG